MTAADRDANLTASILGIGEVIAAGIRSMHRTEPLIDPPHIAWFRKLPDFRRLSLFDDWFLIEAHDFDSMDDFVRDAYANRTEPSNDTQAMRIADEADNCDQATKLRKLAAGAR